MIENINNPAGYETLSNSHNNIISVIKIIFNVKAVAESLVTLSSPWGFIKLGYVCKDTYNNAYNIYNEYYTETKDSTEDVSSSSNKTILHDILSLGEGAISIEKGIQGTLSSVTSLSHENLATLAFQTLTTYKNIYDGTCQMYSSAWNLYSNCYKQVSSWIGNDSAEQISATTLTEHDDVVSTAPTQIDTPDGWELFTVNPEEQIPTTEETVDLSKLQNYDVLLNGEELACYSLCGE